jgi:hypothetical protein
MSTPSQIGANRANAQHSTGPKTETGKAASCLNNFRHGLSGLFSILPSEDQSRYDALVEGLRDEYHPSTPTEAILVEKMAQHLWLTQRAQRLAGESIEDEKSSLLFLRYQTTNDRAFHKCLDQLLKLRAEKRKAEIGFESQERKRKEEARKEAEDARKQEMHEARVRLANAKAQHLEIDSDIRQTIEAPLPGHMRIPFEDLKSLFKVAVDQFNRQTRTEKAA